jgi:hypothetical protein
MQGRAAPHCPVECAKPIASLYRASLYCTLLYDDVIGRSLLAGLLSRSQGNPETPEKGVITVSYANADERSRLVAGFRALADFLQDHPDVPAPRWADVYVFPPRGTDGQMRAEIDQIAARIGAEPIDDTAYGHYAAARRFGPVQYRAVAISQHPDNIDGEGE